MVSSGAFYRQAAGEGASYIGLLVVVYDTLAGDLRRAGEAAAVGRIGERCEATNHALLLLGHLESWADSLEEVALRTSLAQFYGYIRSQAMALQVSTTREGFVELAALVEETRAAWQQKAMTQTENTLKEAAEQTGFRAAEEADDGLRMSWSA